MRKKRKKFFGAKKIFHGKKNSAKNFFNNPDRILIFAASTSKQQTNAQHHKNDIPLPTIEADQNMVQETRTRSDRACYKNIIIKYIIKYIF